MKALLLVAMNMEETDSPINFQAIREQVTDPPLQIDPVLAHHIIVVHYPLIGINIGGPNRFQKGPVHVLLLFPTKYINNAARSEAPMPSACNSNNSSNITCFGGGQGILDSSKINFTRRILC